MCCPIYSRVQTRDIRLVYRHRYDYQPNGRELNYETTILEQKTANIQLKEITTEKEYVKFRLDRDKMLSEPKLLVASIQSNINPGN